MQYRLIPFQKCINTRMHQREINTKNEINMSYQWNKQGRKFSKSNILHNRVQNLIQLS